MQGLFQVNVLKINSIFCSKKFRYSSYFVLHLSQNEVYFFAIRILEILGKCRVCLIDYGYIFPPVIKRYSTFLTFPYNSNTTRYFHWYPLKSGKLNGLFQGASSYFVPFLYFSQNVFSFGTFQFWENVKFDLLLNLLPNQFSMKIPRCV